MGKLNPDKIRIMVSVKKTSVDEFRNAAKSLGLNRNVLSEVVEDALIKTAKIFRLAEEKGKTFSVVDLFHMVGEEMENLQEMERKNDEKSAQKTEGVAKMPRR